MLSHILLVHNTQKTWAINKIIVHIYTTLTRGIYGRIVGTSLFKLKKLGVGDVL